VSYAVIGGLAVSVRSEPRVTRDADLAVAVASDREAEALVRELIGRGYRILAQLEQDDTHRLATVRLVSPNRPDANSFVVDLMFASCGIETEVVRDASTAEVFPGVSLPVATRAHLIAMKVLSTGPKRFQDRGDLHALIQRASEAEIGSARAAVATIHQRHSARTKDLVADLERILKEEGRS